MKKLFLLIVLFVFVGVTTLLAQTKVITGTITSAVEGEGPIPGVTVQVKGTTIGTTTDVNGKYSIEVPQNATTLVFSYIGMKKQEVDISGRSVINGMMESEMLGLNEVVVSAFGIKRNAAEIGFCCYHRLRLALITQAKATNAAPALSGKVAGLQINTMNASVSPDVRVILRGNRSFLGNNQALLVLDGVPVSLSYLSNTQPERHQSMNVLKGGNAAALYGSEASNGVIVVTTKGGSRDRTTVYSVVQQLLIRLLFSLNYKNVLVQDLQPTILAIRSMKLSKISAMGLNLMEKRFRLEYLTNMVIHYLPITLPNLKKRSNFGTPG